MNIDAKKSVDAFCDWVADAHRQRNQKYAGYDYRFHLIMVADIVRNYEFLVTPSYESAAIAAAYAHDYIEDACGTYNDLISAVKLKTDFGDKGAVYIAEISRACCSLTRGRNREERMPDWIYEDIRNTQDADIIKIADRIANVTYSKSSGSSMYDKYRKENQNFIEKVTSDHEYLNPMLKHLDSLF